MAKSKQSLRASIRRLSVENLEERRMLTAVPFGATSQDTGEFFLGRIAVTPVLLESDGSLDASTEDWTPAQIQNVVSNIEEGLQFWTDLLATQTTVHELDWVIDSEFIDNPFETQYEPISRVSNDFRFWANDFVEEQGFSTGNINRDIREFNHAQRLKHDANWSFTIFIVNSENDSDGNFRVGGSFSRAFAFAGGQFVVSPSTRPASTIAHEVGHIFYARDEFPGGGNFFQRRGYYNTQNTNAIDLNPDPDFVQQPSIMAAGTLLQTAFTNRISPASTLAQLGWQDSDGDGIFDVLDVPNQLSGAGTRLSDTEYRFSGTASVQTLPNQNSSGLQNDITINRINSVQYRLNGGEWIEAATPDDYVVDIDFTVQLPEGATGTIEVRAVDSRIGIESNIFSADLSDPAAGNSLQGINGFVFNDADENEVIDQGESGLEGFIVELVDENGDRLQTTTSVEPDDLSVGFIPNDAFPGVTLTTVGDDSDGNLGIITSVNATTGSSVFAPVSFFQGDLLNSFFGRDHNLRIDFDSPTSAVSIDAIANSTESFARIEAYDINDNLLERFTSEGIVNGESTNIGIQRDQSDIAYAIVRPHAFTSIQLDNLQFGPEAATQTDANGSFALQGLAPGQYNVRVTAPSASFELTSTSNIQSVVVADGEVVVDVDFGAIPVASPWHNVSAPVDVDADGFVRPRDALLIINAINNNGSGALDELGLPNNPFIDVTNDGQLQPRDALLVISFLNSNGSGPVDGAGGGEGEPGSLNRLSGLASFDVSSFVDVFDLGQGDLANSTENSDQHIFPILNSSRQFVGPVIPEDGFIELITDRMTKSNDLSIDLESESVDLAIRDLSLGIDKDQRV